MPKNKMHPAQPRFARLGGVHNNHGIRDMVVLEALRVKTTGSVLLLQQDSSGNCCEGEI
jgi:hypothetical protein